MIAPFTLRAPQNFCPLYLDFTDTTKTIDTRITFARASSATYIGNDGLLKTAGSGVARAHAFANHDIATLSCLGFLIEEQATNNALWCRDFTNAAWTKTNMTAALTATGVDGAANSASTLTATAGNATVLQTFTAGSAKSRVSCYVKRRTGTGNIDMTTDGGATWTTITITSSWRRYNIPLQTLANPQFGFRIVTSGDAIDVDYFQQEQKDLVTSAILTTTAAATRLADTATISGTNFGQFWNSTEGSIVVWWSLPQLPTTAQFPGIVCVNDGTQNNEVQLLIIGTNGRMAQEAHNGGVQIVNANGHAVTVAGTQYKASMNFKTNSYSSALNGTVQPEDTSGTMPTVTQMLIGRERSSTYPLNGHIQRIAYYKLHMSRTVLGTITA